MQSDKGKNICPSTFFIGVAMTIVVVVIAWLAENGGYPATWFGCENRYAAESCFNYPYRDEDKGSFGGSIVFGLLTVAVWTGISAWFSRWWLLLLLLTWIVMFGSGSNWGQAANLSNIFTFLGGALILTIGAAIKCNNAHKNEEERKKRREERAARRTASDIRAIREHLERSD